MITRMEIVYRSKEPCNVEPEIFSTGGYTISQNGKELTFDFEETYAGTRFENGYLYIDSTQRNLDRDVSEGISSEKLDNILKSVKKEDFTEIYNECFVDEGETQPIELIPESMIFYRFSESGDFIPFEVGGASFSNLT